MRHFSLLLLLTTLTVACGKGGDGDDTDVIGDDTDVVDTNDTDTCAGVVDDCGVCDGGNADKDCAGTCFGEAVVDVCGTCDDDFMNDCAQSYTASGAWDCAAPYSCLDLYELAVAAGTTLTIDVGSVTGYSVVRMALYAPGDGVGDLNLLTNTVYDRSCGPQDDGAHVEITADTAGTYTLVVGRDWPNSSNEAGTYELEVQGDPGLISATPTGDDVEQTENTLQCEYSFAVDSDWDCAGVDSCRDVYDFDLPAGVDVSLQVVDVTGSSVPMLAVYAPGVPLSGENVLTGGDTDLMCTSQDEDLVSQFTTTSAGVWRVAVGRDWGQSSGLAGTYHLVVGESGAAVDGVQTVDDVDSESSGTTCIL